MTYRFAPSLIYGGRIRCDGDQTAATYLAVDIEAAENSGIIVVGSALAADQMLGIAPAQSCSHESE
ncbi:hypothetical protein [Bradyrhizobium paxllaeri]|uniref:hypothetical protein n=1 Tax=Bradyrhizobium paxllaeri TaxID=190148 RepID=UPI001146E8B8|nr:hypothetical protein [Bradyrhizobium paxllaeri]